MTIAFDHARSPSAAQALRSAPSIRKRDGRFSNGSTWMSLALLDRFGQRGVDG
jgi:hypothetical protein